MLLIRLRGASLTENGRKRISCLSTTGSFTMPLGEDAEVAFRSWAWAPEGVMQKSISVPRKVWRILRCLDECLMGAVLVRRIGDAATESQEGWTSTLSGATGDLYAPKELRRLFASTRDHVPN